MSNFDAWLNDSEAISESVRAAIAWSRIQDKPTSLVLEKPDGIRLAAQVVRIEVNNRLSLAQTAGGSVLGPVRGLIVFGIQNHETETDTDMGEGYRFILGGAEYRITSVISTLGSLQGNAEASG